MKRFSEILRFDEVDYVIDIADDYEVSFFARARDPGLLGVVDDSWDMPDFYVSGVSHGSCCRPVAVLREIMRVINGWVEKNAPPFLYCASSDLKKLLVYMRMIERLPIGKMYDVKLSEMVSGIYYLNAVRIA